MPIPNIVTSSFTLFPMHFKKPLMVNGILFEEVSFLYITFHWNGDDVNYYIITIEKISTCNQTTRFRNIVLVLLI